MEANGTNPEVHKPSTGTSLGERLVAAREAQGLTLEVVASKLRLPAATLQALESNRYESLPEPIFVRGYLRAYARLLEMDQKELVAEYNRLVDSLGPVLTPTTRARRQGTDRYLYIRRAVAMIVVGMVAALGYWWYSRPKHDVAAQFPTASSEAVQSASSASVLPPQPDSRSQVPAPDVASPPDVPSQSLPDEAIGEGSAAADPELPIDETAAAAVEPDIPLTDESPVPINATVDPVVQRQSVDTNIEPAVTDLPIAPLASERGSLVKASRAPTGEDVLVIKANDESWAEVVDANGYQLLYYPLRPGMERRLQGQAPFQVFLGNAPAVDLRLNRKSFDHMPYHHRNRTARFSVDDAS